MKQLKTRSASFTRPNDTTAYAAGDQIANSTSAPVAMSFAAPEAAGFGRIRGAQVIVTANQATKPDVDLVIFADSTPTMANDNAAIAPTNADVLNNLVARLRLAGSTGVSLNPANDLTGQFIIELDTLDIPYACPANLKLFGMLVARNAYTPLAQEKWQVNLLLEEAN